MRPTPVGSGAAGIQTVLGLADSGVFACLVEKTPAIGGVMKQIDKTFPDIELATMATLETVSGKPEHFRAMIKKRERDIDPKRFTGCRGCVDACPVQTISD